VELQRHIDFPSALVKVLDVNKYACTTDIPGLNFVLVMSKEEKTEETWLLPPFLSQRCPNGIVGTGLYDKFV
jgi:hypothetical protein